MENLAVKSFQLRQDILEIIYKGKTGHIGGDFSIIDILTVLYFKEMNINIRNISDENRDLFVLSKGHAIEAYYAVLAAKGFLDIKDVIENFSKFGSKYIGHPNNKLPGIEMNSGSLGHGLSVCVGMAIAGKMNKKDYRVYTVMGDGELAEGSIWEGFMAGNQYKLDNLCAIIDRNYLQISGNTENIIAHENLEERIKSFGWYVIKVNGNNIKALESAFEHTKNLKGKPTAIIAETIKGFGGGEIMENKANWHHKVPTTEEYNIIKKELVRRMEAAQYE